MLIDDKCTIYEHRPRTCRTYDCRIFAATGLRVDDDKALIDQQAQRWQFSYPTAADRTAHDAARMAAGYLRRHPDAFADGAAPVNATQLAVAAVEVHDLFVDGNDPDPREVRVELSRRRDSRRPR
jgi:hypothetical protein